MATKTLRQDVDFQGLFRKLGHNLEEIRVRALENILSKLNHNLICEADLIHERHLFIRLLEWFNFSKAPQQEQVLNFLKTLSQHTSAAEIIQDVGGVEFLSNLRINAALNLQPIIDQILENTLRLPTASVDQHAPECIYHRPVTEHNITQQSNQSGDDSSRSHQSTLTGTTTTQGSSMVNTDKIDILEDPVPRYFTETTEPPTTSNPPPFGFRLTAFPWLALTPTDRHVLESTNRSLQSRDPKMLVSACEFLGDVVFQDFPSEIFLQRPQITKSLWSLLLPSKEKNYDLSAQAADTLTDLTRCLRSRIHFYQDPALYTPNQDFSSASPTSYSIGEGSNQSGNSTDSRPSVVGWNDTRHRGDGRDGDTSSSRASSLVLDGDRSREETDFNECSSLQHHQIYIPQFCLNTMLKSLPLLQTKDETTAVKIFNLLHQVVAIFTEIMGDIWSDSSEMTRDTMDKLQDCLVNISTLLEFHGHQESRSNEADITRHRLIYIGVCNLFVKIIILIPRNKCVSVVPERLIVSICRVVFDESLAGSYGYIRTTLLPYLQELDTQSHHKYYSTSRICQAMKKTCQFVKTVKNGGHLPEDIITMATDALPSMPYHQYLPMVTEFIKFVANHVGSRLLPDKNILSSARKLLLRFLSHPLNNVRQFTYKAVLHHTQAVLNVKEAADPRSRSCLQACFLLDSDILYELVVFGLNDSEKEISMVCTELIHHVLNSRYLMVEDMWPTLIQALYRSFPVIQSYCDMSTKLGQKIWSMLDPKSSTELISLQDKLRGCLRLLFSHDLQVRTRVLERISWFLANEEESDKKIPVFSDLDVNNLCDTLIVKNVRNVEEDIGRSVFQMDSLKQVYDIFNGSSVDPTVKKSAAEQLAIMLHDTNLHTAFRETGGLEVILDILRKSVYKPTDAQTGVPNYLPACISILRYILHHDYNLRHNLAHDPQIYYTLLRVALLYMNDDKTHYDISHILTLLLFDEISKFDVGNSKSGTTFTLPAVVAKRYKLPFKPSCHHDISPHAVTITPDPDPLTSGEAMEMLRISWNLSWNDGMEQLLDLIKLDKKQTDSSQEFSSTLKLTSVDRYILETSCLKSQLQNGVFAISNGTSHRAVIVALDRLLTYITIGHGSSSVGILHEMEWWTVLTRFLEVTPSSAADEELLFKILDFITFLLKLTNCIPDNILQWIGERLYQASGPLIGLLSRCSVGDSSNIEEQVVQMRRLLDKTLLRFISVFNSKLPYQLTRRLSLHQMRGDLVKELFQRLNVTDAPHFYNLASLEGTLTSLMHVTARPGWSEECSSLDPNNLTAQVLNCLLEVVSAFHIGRGGTLMSYMGKGVTKAATLCLRHLAFEMPKISEKDDWQKNWLYSRQGADAVGEPGLNWMLTLWAYRDPEVRAAGLGIAMSLTSTEAGRIMMTSNCKHIPGGIWGAAFTILLNQSECSIVRQQAAMLLINLTSQTMPSGNLEGGQTMWQGPVVTDEEFQMTLVGLPALLALLHHSQFYQQMVVLLSNFYPYASVQTVSVDMETQLPTNESEVSSSAGSTTGTFTPFSFATSQHFSHRSQHLSIGTISSPESTRSYGQGETTSTISPEFGDYIAEHSVVTPCLVTGVTKLLRNVVILAPKDTFECLKRDSFIQIFLSMLDISIVQALCKDLQNGTTCNQTELVLRDLILMYDGIVDLFRVCIVYDTPIRSDILNCLEPLQAIASLLLLECEGSTDIYTCCCKLWRTIFTFFTNLLQIQGSTTLHSLTSVFTKLWPAITDSCMGIIQVHQTQDLYITCLTFLAVLFCEEGKRFYRSAESDEITLTELLDQTSKSKKFTKETSLQSSGSRLCKVLISSYELNSTKPKDSNQLSERTLIINVLKSLLVICQSAKQTALDDGLAETLIENIKQSHSKLSFESVQPSKNTIRKKEDPIIQELVMMYDLLRNFMCQNSDVKTACYHSGLSSVCHKLWAWCQVEPSLMSAMLNLLTTYTAQCSTATSSLAYTSPTGISSAIPGKSPLSSNSLVHSIIKLANRELEKDVSSIIKTIFSLLCNIVMSAEGRNIMWKCNMLSEFTQLNPQKSKKQKPKHKQYLDVLWLDLLVNLSFTTEGQQIMFKVNGAIDLLLDFVEHGNQKCSELSLLILRNLCCHTSNKPKLLANEKLIPYILKVIENGGGKNQRVGTSALWALIYNNQKAKVLMKNANILPKLQESLYNAMNKEQKTSIDEQYSEELKWVIGSLIE